jgi:predicted aldo/keto reductase-like oxidoreductase
MLDKDFRWDTIQFPTNLLDAHYRSFTQEILPPAVERGMGIIGMKSLAGSRVLRAGVSTEEAITFALSLPIHTLVSGIDSLKVLDQNLKIVRSWKPLSEREQRHLLGRVAPFASNGQLEYYKTT